MIASQSGNQNVRCARRPWWTEPIAQRTFRLQIADAITYPRWLSHICISTTMDELDRLFRRLVQNVRNGYPEYLSRPFEVSELYQTLIPYRHNRRELEIDTNQDYEMAICRLLSGERGYAGGDEAMQQALKEEIQSPNPNTGIFREF
ncbi:MAG TPA: hypothetical protein VJ717_06825, partial [Gemmatimonadaceae bacterium]|nr:hypothetical protein [Gemmatimonadaceae bacterium]